MRIQSINQNNYNNYKKQQNFGMVKVSGLEVNAGDIPVEGTLSRRLIRGLIDKLVGSAADARVRDGIGNSIQGLVEQDAWAPSDVVTSISNCAEPYMLRIKKSQGGREVAHLINLDPKDIEQKAQNISPHILEDLRQVEVTEADLVLSGIDPNVPRDWAIKAPEKKLPQPAISPIEFEIGSRFRDAINDWTEN